MGQCPVRGCEPSAATTTARRSVGGRINRSDPLELLVLGPLVLRNGRRIIADSTTSYRVLLEVMNGIAAAVTGTTHALVALEVLPPEAEEALANAGGV